MPDLMSCWPGNQLQTCFVLNYSLEVQLGRQKFLQVLPNQEQQPARKELYSSFVCLFFFSHCISVELKGEHGKGHSGFKVIHIFVKLFVFYLFFPFILYYRPLFYNIYPPPPPHPYITDLKISFTRFKNQTARKNGEGQDIETNYVTFA